MPAEAGIQCLRSRIRLRGRDDVPQVNPTAGAITRRLAAHAVRTPGDAIPPAALAMARRCVLDAMGVALAAGSLGSAVPAFLQLARASGQGPCKVIGQDLFVAPAVAALVNGGLSHALDFEDTHDEGLVHPTGTALPAALAIAQLRGDAGGREFLAALAVGSDITCRLGACMGNVDVPRGWAIRPLLGTYGATAAAGRLLGLDEDAMVEAFGLAFAQATCSAGVFRYGPSHVREVRDGFAAQAAVTAVLLAQGGLRASDRAIEDVFALYAGGAFDAERLLRGLGEVFEGERLSFKPWPSCRGTHAFVEAAIALRAQHGFDAADIERVEAEVSDTFRVLCEPPGQKRRPRTAGDAKFSVPFTTAAALLHGRLGLDAFTPEALADARVLGLAQRVDCRVRAPAGGADALQGRLHVRLRDGRAWAMEVLQLLGDPARPLSDEDLLRKFVDCAAQAPQAWSAGRARAFAAAVRELERATDLGVLRV
jgi:2-methylcitrate dehydratase PrpD